jgi:ribonuclease E
MTRKRIGQGLLEAFSETCEHCKGRGVIVQTEPVVEKPRTNVAEKVRAVAASVRAEAAEVAGAGDDAAAVEGQELDAEVAEVSGSDIPEEPAAVVEDIYTDDRLGGEIEGGQAEDGPGSVRRRSRRGGSRRRARA